MATDREQTRNRIIERLHQLDDDELRRLDSLLADGLGTGPAAADEADPKLLTRRQLLAGLVAGGAVLGGSNLTTAWYAREVGEAAGWQQGAGVAEARTLTRAGQTQTEMQAEIDALRGLVAHYEALESVGLEDTVVQALGRFETSVSGLEHVTDVLVAGVEGVRGGLDRFEATVPAIREGIARVDDVLDALDQRLDGLREVLAETVERAEPVAERLGSFFDAVLTRLPFGVGDRIEFVVLRLRQVVETVPEAVVAVREDLVSPLRTTWFDDANEDDVQAGLLTPVRTDVLDPAEQLLSDLGVVAEAWQRDVTRPIQQTLAEREAMRRSLAEYKQRHGMT